MINPFDKFPDELLGNLFGTYLPNKNREYSDGLPPTGYDIRDLERVACVCKKWKEVCNSRKEWGPYVSLFRRQLSLYAPFPGQGLGTAASLYMYFVNRCKGWHTD